VDAHYAALAVFLVFLAAFGCDFASVFRFAAHRWRILSEAASRWAAVNFLRVVFTGVGAETAATTFSGFFGGLPRRLVGP
jgi:hypothetical protein